MSTEQVDAEKQLPVQVDNWDALNQYAQVSEKNVNICVIDEEQEEIRLENQEEFDLNVKYAQEHGIESLTFVIYIDGKRVFNGIHRIENTVESIVFPLDKLQILLDNVLAEKWYIPVKLDEAFGVCLTAAIDLARENKSETVIECQTFIEKIVPEAFRKLQHTHSVLSWPRDIQCGIFDLLELLIDLAGTRLRYPPVPITLLKTLSMTFDTASSFSQKHKNELVPTRRVYTLKEADFLSNDFDNETFGWLRSIIQRFIAQNGLANVRLQFEYIDSSNSTAATMEYNALLKLFANCQRCINTRRFRTFFNRPIRQVIQYLRAQKTLGERNDELKELHATVFDICYKYELQDEMNSLLELSSNPNLNKLSSSSVNTCSEITPLIENPRSVQQKSKKQDCYERLAEDLRSLTIDSQDLEPKNIKKQRTNEPVPTPLFTRHHLMDCIDELLTTTDKHSLKRKHRREQQRSILTTIHKSHGNQKNEKRSKISQTYDRSNPEDILRHFAPLKLKIVTLYDNLQASTSNGNLREVLKIEEKLKLLHPFSARFVADENTPDGSRMKPGEVFRKGWILLNDGSMPWDSTDIQLLNLSNGIEILRQPIVPVTAPHARAVITVDYRCANQAGTYESKWILAYRQQTFGPMIWCSIKVNPTNVGSMIKEDALSGFELIEIPLPVCFDLSKPFQAQNSFRSISRDDSIESLSNAFNFDTLRNPSISDSDSLLNLMSLPPTNRLISIEQPETLTEFAPAVTDNAERSLMRLNQSLDLVDTVVTNVFSVAKQAGSTAKAIFNTLQAIDEPNPPVEEAKPMLINSFDSIESNTNAFFDRIESTSSVHSMTSKDPMKSLIEMGFANRAKNQRLLKENGNDLATVISLLTLENNEDVEWFTHRH